MQKLFSKTDSLILGFTSLCVVFVIAYAILSADGADTRSVASAERLTLSTAMAESGAQCIATSARCWETIDGNADLDTALQTLRTILGDDDLLSFEEYDDQGYTGFSVRGTTAQGFQLDLIMQTIGEGEYKETYLIVEASEKGGDGNIDSLRDFLSELCTALGMGCDPSFMIEGEYPEILSKREKKAVAKRIFRTMEGEVTEKVSDASYVSFSGLSEHLGSGVASGKHNVNLQTALSDNEEESRTHIYIGSPVVFSDF